MQSAREEYGLPKALYSLYQQGQERLLCINNHSSRSLDILLSATCSPGFECSSIISSKLKIKDLYHTRIWHHLLPLLHVLSEKDVFFCYNVIFISVSLCCRCHGSHQPSPRRSDSHYPHVNNNYLLGVNWVPAKPELLCFSLCGEF